MLKIPAALHSDGLDAQNPLTGVVLVNLFSIGFEGSGRKIALISCVNALAVGEPARSEANNSTETTLRTATDKGFIYTTSYIKANPCKLEKEPSRGARTLLPATHQESGALPVLAGLAQRVICQGVRRAAQITDHQHIAFTLGVVRVEAEPAEQLAAVAHFQGR